MSVSCPPAAQHWATGWFISDRLPPFVPLRLGYPQGRGCHKGWGRALWSAPQLCHSGPSGHHCGLRRRESTAQSLWPWVAGAHGAPSGTCSGQTAQPPGPPSGWGSGPSSNLVLIGDGEAPGHGNWVISQGPSLLPRVGTPCPAPRGSGEGGVLVTLRRLAGPGDRISSPLSLSKAPSCQAISGRDQDGPPGNLPKTFSLVPLGKDPEKACKCPSSEGGRRVGPGRPGRQKPLGPGKP